MNYTISVIIIIIIIIIISSSSSSSSTLIIIIIIIISIIIISLVEQSRFTLFVLLRPCSEPTWPYPASLLLMMMTFCRKWSNVGVEDYLHLVIRLITCGLGLYAVVETG